MTEVRTAADPGERRFAAIFLMLRTPGLQPLIRSGFGRTEKVASIGNYRDNWWTLLVGPAERPVNALFLSAKQREQGQSEAEQLKIAAENGVNFLSAEAVRWVRAHPSDPRGAEALARAVKATRYGTTDLETGKYSKAAFDLLKSTYKGTSWERQTPYWFK
jgi:hypothetical protein